MSFFRRDEEAESANPMTRSQQPTIGSSAARERAVTRIAAGSRITGEIGGDTELLVEGELQGRIKVESRVVIGPGGVVRGQITARSVVIAGTVEGDVRGSDRVEVAASGKLQGDISAPRVTISEGAFFKGKVEMGGKDGGRRSQPAPKPPPAADGGSSRGLFPEGGEEGSKPEGSASPGGGSK